MHITMISFRFTTSLGLILLSKNEQKKIYAVNGFMLLKGSVMP